MLPALVKSLCAGQLFTLSSSAEQNWDYLYAADGADALYVLAERGCAGEIYNIAHGDYRPLRAFTEEARAVLAPHVVISYGTADAGAFSLQPSTEKIRRDTGWRAVTAFVDGLCRGYGLAHVAWKRGMEEKRDGAGRGTDTP